MSEKTVSSLTKKDLLRICPDLATQINTLTDSQIAQLDQSHRTKLGQHEVREPASGDVFNDWAIGITLKGYLGLPLV